MLGRWTIVLAALMLALGGCSKKPEPLGDTTKPPAAGELRPFNPGRDKIEKEKAQVPAPPDYRKTDR